MCGLKCVFVHFGVRFCLLHTRSDEGFFFFWDHLPEWDIKAIGALSVLVTFPGLNKRDAAETLHLLGVNSTLFFSLFLFKTDDYMVW